MKKIGRIHDLDHWLDIYEENGHYYFTRSDLGDHIPSKQWEWLGAYRINNFGHIVESLTPQIILQEKPAWLHKNGSQWLHIRDLDHGTTRVWMGNGRKNYFVSKGA